MHSGLEIPGIHPTQHEPENTCAPVLLSTNPTHILDQIHILPPTQLFLDQLHFLPPYHHQGRLNPQYVGGGAPSPAYIPMNFKLGLNEICQRHDYKDGAVSSINGGEDALLRGSEQYEVPQARQSSLGMLHCFQNQEYLPNKQPPFWEALSAEVSNENSEIVDRQEMNQKETLTNCLEGKCRVHFGELEAIYRRVGTAESTQTSPAEIQPMNAHLPVGFDHGSEASIEKEASASMKDTRKKRKKKKKKESSYNQLINPMVEFFGNLVKQVMNHQENVQKKFAEVIARLDEERRAREEAWRKQELAHFEREAEERAHEKALAERREAMIISYLEKFTGERIDFPSFNPAEMSRADTSDDFGGNDEQDEAQNELELRPPGCSLKFKTIP